MKSHLAVCAGLLLLLQGAMAAESPTFRYLWRHYEHSKPTDSITTVKEEKRTVFLVTDSIGIRKARITLASGQWPQQIALRFQYEKGQGFKQLEGFNLTTAALQVRGGMHTSGKMDFYFPDADGKYDTGKAPAGQMNVVVEVRDDAMEVTLPPNLLAQSKDVRIEWIDAYR